MQEYRISQVVGALRMDHGKIRMYIRDKGGIALWKGIDGLMGTRNTRASQSPLHLQIDALILAIECIKNLRQFDVTFATYCFQLVKIVSESEK